MVFLVGSTNHGQCSLLLIACVDFSIYCLGNIDACVLIRYIYPLLMIHINLTKKKILMIQIKVVYISSSIQLDL